MILYENYEICILMNINENLNNERKPFGKLKTEGSKTYFVPLRQFLTDEKLFNGTTKMQSCIVLKNSFGLHEITWFQFQPIIQP